MDQQNYEALVREATRLFLMAQADPTDETRRHACRDFVSRSANHERIFERVKRVHSAAGKKPGPSTLVCVLAFIIACIAGYTGYEPMRVLALSDYRTARAPVAVDLNSGDDVTLDARSAIADNTNSEVRRIEILRGAAFFEVGSDGRPFVVNFEDLSVRVIGTSFEVSALNGTVMVVVTEGVVDVTSDKENWTLKAGDRLRINDGVAARDMIDVESVAPWRQNQLIAEGMTFGEVAAVIDRRLPGTILIPSGDLANTIVSGGVSLEDPEMALNILAAAENARVVSLPALGKIIWPSQ
ncbi:MAG: FecR domain-containing protein [Pseudomonadota bacterium]